MSLGNEIHVWQIPLSKAFWQSPPDILSPTEQQRAQKFIFEKDRQSFVLARVALKCLLGDYLRLKGAQIRLAYQEQGKPFVAQYPQIQFNLSHSGEYALFAINWEQPLGVDIEHHKPEVEFELVAQHFFSSTEYEALLDLTPWERMQAFYRIWTRKESFIKALGTGLSFPLDQFSVTHESEEAHLIHTEWDAQEKENWSLYSISTEPNYSAALALQSKEAKLIRQFYWNWNTLKAF